MLLKSVKLNLNKENYLITTHIDEFVVILILEKEIPAFIFPFLIVYKRIESKIGSIL